MRDAVQAHVAEPVTATGWFTPTNVDRWIQDGIEVIFLRLAGTSTEYFGVKTQTFSYSVGVQEYSLSNLNPYEIRKIVVTDRSPPLTLSQSEDIASDIETFTSPAEPQKFYWRVDYNGADPITVVGLLPPAGRSATSNAVLHYIPRPRAVTGASDTPDLPLEFHYLAVLWASAQAIQSDQRDASPLFGQFEKRMIDLIGQAARGRAGGPKYIHYIDGY
jgi:hypothetical protein